MSWHDQAYQSARTMRRPGHAKWVAKPQQKSTRSTTCLLSPHLNIPSHHRVLHAPRYLSCLITGASMFARASPTATDMPPQDTSVNAACCLSSSCARALWPELGLQLGRRVTPSAAARYYPQKLQMDYDAKNKWRLFVGGRKMSAIFDTNLRPAPKCELIQFNQGPEER